MSSGIAFIDVPYARKSSTSTYSSSLSTSDTQFVRHPSDIHPTIVVLDESVLDPGKLSSRFVVLPMETPSLSKSLSKSLSSGAPNSITKSDSSLCKPPRELKCEEVLANDPVLDPNKAHSRPPATCSAHSIENEQMSKSSISAGNYSPSARIPDGQTDDPDDNSSTEGVRGDYPSDQYETESESDGEGSDNDAEYTPSNSCTDGYLPSGFESEGQEYDSLRNAVSKSSTLSSHKNKMVKVNSHQRKDKVNSTECAGNTKRNLRPKTAVHRESEKISISNSRPKTAAGRSSGRSVPKIKSFTTKQHAENCINKEQQKTKSQSQRVDRKAKQRSPREKKHTAGNLSFPKSPPGLRRGSAGTCKRPQHSTEKRNGSMLEFRQSPYHRKKNKTTRTFQSRVGGKFVNLVEDVVTQMSLLGDDDNNDIDSASSPVIPVPKSKGKKRKKVHANKVAKNTQKGKITKKTSPRAALRPNSSSSKLLMEQLFKWKNDYMRGLSMYIEDQLKHFDKSNSLTWNTLSYEGRHKKKENMKSTIGSDRLADPERKSCHICEKKPISILKLKSIWSRPGTASKSGKVLPRLLISSEKVTPLGNETDKDHLRKEVKQTLNALHLPRNSLRVLGASEIKLVCNMGQLIMVGEGATSISFLGNLKSERAFVVIKMFKLPYAGGKTREIIDQSILACHVNKSEAIPKFYGLVALDSDESTVVGVHNVAMAFKFVGHTPSCAVTTLSSLCEKASTSQMYRDPDADTSTCQLNAVIIVKKIIAAMNKVHCMDVVMPGLDICKVLLCEEEGATRPYLTSRLHPMRDPHLAWPMVAYLGLKNSKPSSYSQKQKTEVPPESVRRGTFSIKSDVFQLGKMMLHVGQAFNISHLQYLARRCLRQDSLHRPDIPKIQSEIEKIVGEYQNSDS